MRILAANYVERNENSGSAGQLIHWARAMESLGHEVDLLFGDDPVGAPFVDAVRSPPHLFWAFPLRLAAYLAHVSEPYDVVQVTDVDGWPAIRHARRHGNRSLFIMKIQGLMDRLHRTRMELADEGLLTMRLRHRVAVRALRLVPLAMQRRMPDLVLSESRRDLDWLERERGYPAERNRHLIQGIHDIFLSSDAPVRVSRTALFVGRFEPVKGAHLLERLVDQVEGLVVAGTGQDRGELLARHSFLRRLKHFEVYPTVSREELRQLYESCGCLVHPSLSEGTPNVVLEAAACGLPVVTTADFGTLDVLDDSSAALFPRGDAGAFAKRVSEVFDDTTETRHRAVRARQRVAGLTYRLMAESFVNIVDEFRSRDDVG